MFRPCKFTTSDGDEVYEGWTDGTTYNKWDNICLTEKQVIEFFKAEPYDIRFEGTEGRRELLIWWESNSHETILSSPLPTCDGDILGGFFLDMEFVEVTNES